MKALYTYYVVTRNADDHYPVLVARNKKIPLNESVKRTRVLEKAINNLEEAFTFGRVAVVRITHTEFKKLYPKFAKNAGPKKK